MPCCRCLDTNILGRLGAALSPVMRFAIRKASSMLLLRAFARGRRPCVLPSAACRTIDNSMTSWTRAVIIIIIIIIGMASAGADVGAGNTAVTFGAAHHVRGSVDCKGGAVVSSHPQDVSEVAAPAADGFNHLRCCSGCCPQGQAAWPGRHGCGRHG